MALGELQIKPDDFWKLTGAEFTAIIRGYVIRRDSESANHRNLFTLMSNLHRKKGSGAKQPNEAWELDIDNMEEPMSVEDRLNWYKKIGNEAK